MGEFCKHELQYYEIQPTPIIRPAVAVGETRAPPSCNWAMIGSGLPATPRATAAVPFDFAAGDAVAHRPGSAPGAGFFSAKCWDHDLFSRCRRSGSGFGNLLEKSHGRPST